LEQTRFVEGLISIYSEGKDGIFMASETDYYHYTCCGELDRGWGCSYRCCQMLLSNLKKNGKIQFDSMPTLLDIQITLATVAKKVHNSDIGSHTWIEPPDCNDFIITRYPHIQNENFVFIPAKDNFDDLLNKIQNHFINIKTPIMIDDTIYSYVLTGIQRIGDKTNLLRFDPHAICQSTKEDYISISKESDPEDTLGVEWLPAKKVFSCRTNIWLMLFVCNSQT